MKQISRAKQQGAALIISLVILVVMTMIGTASVSVSSMEERMVGNTQDKYFSFQQAEMALRQAEDVVRDLGTDQAFEGVDGFYEPCSSTPCWDSGSVTWQAVTDDTTTAFAEDQHQRYIVESMGRTPIDDECPLVIPPDQTCYAWFYRATGQGDGNTTNTTTIVQSHLKFIK